MRVFCVYLLVLSALVAQAVINAAETEVAADEQQQQLTLEDVNETEPQQENAAVREARQFRRGFGGGRRGGGRFYGGGGGFRRPIYGGYRRPYYGGGFRRPYYGYGFYPPPPPLPFYNPYGFYG